jgi:hypothetical protein
MASSHIVSKTLEDYEKHDPIRNLWRNVLIIALEDLLKNKKNKQCVQLNFFLKKKCGFLVKTLN